MARSTRFTLAYSAGIWTNWTSIRNIKEGEATVGPTNDFIDLLRPCLFAFFRLRVGRSSPSVIRIGTRYRAARLQACCVSENRHASRFFSGTADADVFPQRKHYSAVSRRHPPELTFHAFAQHIAAAWVTIFAPCQSRCPAAIYIRDARRSPQ